MVGFGYKSYVGFAAESVWGTKSTTSEKYLEINSEGLTVTENVGHSASLNSINTNVNRRYQSNIDAGGDISCDMRYSGAELLFKHLLGTVATTGPTDSLYTHTFTIADELPSPGLTFEINRDIAAYFLTGGKIASAKFSIAQDGVLNASFTITGKDITTGAKTTESLPTTNLVVYSKGVVQYGGSNAEVVSFDINFNNNLDSGRRFIGSRNIVEQYRAGRIECTGTLNLEFDTVAKYDDFRNATTRALTVLFTDDTLIGAASYASIGFYMNIAKITNANPVVNSEGRILYNCDFKTYLSGSDEEFKVIIKNTVTTV